MYWVGRLTLLCWPLAIASNSHALGQRPMGRQINAHLARADQLDSASRRYWYASLANQAPWLKQARSLFSLRGLDIPLRPSVSKREARELFTLVKTLPLGFAYVDEYCGARSTIAGLALQLAGVSSTRLRFRWRSVRTVSTPLHPDAKVRWEEHHVLAVDVEHGPGAELYAFEPVYSANPVPATEIQDWLNAEQPWREQSRSLKRTPVNERAQVHQVIVQAAAKALFELSVARRLAAERIALLTAMGRSVELRN